MSTWGGGGGGIRGEHEEEEAREGRVLTKTVPKMKVSKLSPKKRRGT